MVAEFLNDRISFHGAARFQAVSASPLQLALGSFFNRPALLRIPPGSEVCLLQFVFKLRQRCSGDRISLFTAARAVDLLRFSTLCHYLLEDAERCCSPAASANPQVATSYSYLRIMLSSRPVQQLVRQPVAGTSHFARMYLPLRSSVSKYASFPAIQETNVPKLVPSTLKIASRSGISF
jgi:hypothetical protein